MIPPAHASMMKNNKVALRKLPILRAPLPVSTAYAASQPPIKHTVRMPPVTAVQSTPTAAQMHAAAQRRSVRTRHPSSPDITYSAQRSIEKSIQKRTSPQITVSPSHLTSHCLLCLYYIARPPKSLSHPAAPMRFLHDMLFVYPTSSPRIRRYFCFVASPPRR